MKTQTETQQTEHLDTQCLPSLIKWRLFFWWLFLSSNPEHLTLFDNNWQQRRNVLMQAEMECRQRASSPRVASSPHHQQLPPSSHQCRALWKHTHTRARQCPDEQTNTSNCKLPKWLIFRRASRNWSPPQIVFLFCSPVLKYNQFA